MPSITWKSLVWLLLASWLGGAVLCTPAAAQDKVAMTVTLLGTGSPIPEPFAHQQVSPRDRMGAMTLVRAGGEVLLFDAGRGVVQRLSQAGVEAKDITEVFLSLFNSDHVTGLPDLWLTGRLKLAWGGRTTPLDVIGPHGTEAFMANIAKAYQPDLNNRPSQPKVGLVGHDFDHDGVVFDRNGVKVTMFTVDHAAAKPAVAYRVDYKGHSVLIAHDTRYHPNVIKYGKGVDLLVHEVLAVNPAALKKHPGLKVIFNLHTSPEQVGEIFTQTKPKLAVLTHIVLMGSPAFKVPFPAPTVQDLIKQVRQTYQGPLVAGVDLMSFEVGDKVTTISPTQQISLKSK